MAYVVDENGDLVWEDSNAGDAYAMTDPNMMGPQEPTMGTPNAGPQEQTMGDPNAGPQEPTMGDPNQGPQFDSSTGSPAFDWSKLWDRTKTAIGNKLVDKSGNLTDAGLNLLGGAGGAGIAALLANSDLAKPTPVTYGAGAAPGFVNMNRKMVRTPVANRTGGNYFNTTYAAKGGMMPGGSHASSTGGLGYYLGGPTDGMADKIHATIDGKQPARLAHGEFVIPADVVSHLGNGNSDAGAQKLYQMMSRIRKARTGNPNQGKEINPDKFMPKMAAGGIVGFAAGGTTDATGLGGGVVATEQGVSNWAAPYVGDMLSNAQAAANAPYQAYQGPLTAGTSPLQDQAFQQAGNLQVPASIGQAADTAGGIATQAQNLSYSPTNYSSTYQATDPYQAGTFTNQFNAPQAYQGSNITSGTFNNAAAQQYMNPYLSNVLNPQLDELRRQAGITQVGNDAKMTQAGAFGGDRQALLTAENNRNLMQQQDQTVGNAYNTAYNNAMNQFNQDQSRGLTAQQLNEQSRQFGATQGMTAAQLQAQYGLSADQAAEASRQFGANQALSNAQNAAQYGQQANNLNAQDRQFGAQYGLNALNTALQGAQTQGNLGVQQGNQGIANLNAVLNAGNTQRDIAQQGITANLNAFNQERDNPYKMLEFQKSMLSGLPITAQGTTTLTPSILQQMAGGAAGGVTLSDILNGKTGGTTKP